MTNSESVITDCCRELGRNLVTLADVLPEALRLLPPETRMQLALGMTEALEHVGELASYFAEGVVAVRALRAESK